MVIFQENIGIEIQWKKIKCFKNTSYVVFEVVPMCRGKDFVLFPSEKKWKEIENIFSYKDRENIILLLKNTNWKRDMEIVEMDIEPFLNRELNVQKGMIESTKGYEILSRENLFDVNSRLSKEQVKQIYLALEKKFAEEAKGKVIVPKELLISGSVLKEISIPILKKNRKVMICIQ